MCNMQVRSTFKYVQTCCRWKSQMLRVLHGSEPPQVMWRHCRRCHAACLPSERVTAGAGSFCMQLLYSHSKRSWTLCWRVRLQSKNLTKPFSRMQRRSSGAVGTPSLEFYFVVVVVQCWHPLTWPWRNRRGMGTRLWLWRSRPVGWRTSRCCCRAEHHHTTPTTETSRLCWSVVQAHPQRL